jgi:hypothetical protein
MNVSNGAATVFEYVLVGSMSQHALTYHLTAGLSIWCQQLGSSVSMACLPFLLHIVYHVLLVAQTEA